MGCPMAHNLLRAGHEVALWSHNAAKARELASAEKGLFCATPKEVAENADVIFLIVGDTAMSREAILGENGIIAGARRGLIVADASTISPTASRQIGQALAAKRRGLSGCSVHRLESRRGRRYADVHDRGRCRRSSSGSGRFWK